ncbi:MAG: glycosyltransferase family 39 protein [bacterium]
MTISSDQKKSGWIIFSILAAAFLLRACLAPIFSGHPTDISCFKAWADHVYTNGFANFYSKDYFCDYPPAYFYVLYIIGFIRNIFSISFDSPLYLFLIKLPAITADILTSWLIFRLARRRFEEPASLALSLAYAFNPAVLINSTAWGQVDSILALLLALALQLFTEKKFVPATVVFTAAALFKPQALFLAPLVLLILFCTGSWKTIVLSLLSSLASFAVIVTPFSLSQGLNWLVVLYQKSTTTYPYATLNAFNLYSLVGGNWAPIADKLFFLTFGLWSLILTAIAYVFVLYIQFKSKEKNRLYLLSLILVSAAFVCGAYMHERYLFPALILALLSYIGTADRRLLYIFSGLSAVQFINIAMVLSESAKKNFFIPQGDPLMIGTSLATVLIFVYTLFVGWDICIKGCIQTGRQAVTCREPVETEAWPIQESEKTPPITRLDYLLAGTLTLIYAVFALINLGSLKAPQTFWMPRPKESITVDFGDMHKLKRLYYYGLFENAVFSIESSKDGQTWSPPQKSTFTDTFSWDCFDLNQEGRFARLTIECPRARIFEVAFYGENQNKPLPVTLLLSEQPSTPEGGGASSLFDEQDTAGYNPTFRDGMYFDEIYHGRTAYEHLHRIEPYESTHPPLGKILISLGIAIFGMDPFGWRIVGTLFGILMVPLMYLFGKALFKRTRYAFMTSFLMTFDFMHFSQTRISTIDVYGVFFIILMYYFMYRYYSLNFFKTDFKKTLVPLGLSGLFFGIGVACKWIGIYAGGGLFILLIIKLFQRYLEYVRAQRFLEGDAAKNAEDKREIMSHIVRVFPKYLAGTLACSVVFFFIIPAIIYVLSYIPFMMVPGPGHGLKDIWSYQQHIFNYHKNLKATHPFSSNWWSWPLMIKPIWYYGGQKFIPADKVLSIVSMGNPAVWWSGILAVIAAIVLGIKKKDWMILAVLVGLAAQYVPWMLVPRLTFIYHFFASVPFMIFCLVYVIRHLEEIYPVVRRLVPAYLGLVFLLFLMYYPILSGMLVSKSYVEHFLRWFPGWNFYI